MSLPRYPKYRNSGAPWLGDVPAHWQISPLKRLIDIQNGADHKAVEQPDGYPVIGSGGAFAFASDYLYDGEAVLLGRKGTIDKPLHVTGKFWTVDTMYWSKIKPGASGRFSYYAALTIPFSYYSTSTALPSMTKSALNAHSIACPPLEEQTIIAAFLDRETAKIDALIAEQEKLLTLLSEKRQATISHAVTRGINRDAPMKDSGAVWLGKVPAHWEVCRVKDVARLESGHTPSKQIPEYWEDCEIPWVSLNDSKHLAKHDYISDTAVKINELGLANSSARMLPAGAVVFTRDATIGLASITTIPMAVSQHLIAWCPSQRITSLYLLRVFNAMKPHLDSYTFGATIKTIGMGDVKKLVTPVPPVEEQQEIAAFIDSETTKLDELKANAERGIDLLKERRSALISAAVTGKIDVRNAVPQELAA
ncbi:restriction endonuclease subunit S [Paraburkholderia sp. CNPSo 3272]|uniref:restriction endonuclease subunit S n=1 Tax=Paraburkholderia sp. CNPSo 3272 TaxID=2940931 RepID=UPI0020B6D970|nr:restriction endonuclease subunit S [Paraburkholderia sp. CNPSo 3272]MCP3728394.1 restriction endonuclease subunit S [Paraburkholderia sp. CNPSo 3272]